MLSFKRKIGVLHLCSFFFGSTLLMDALGFRIKALRKSDDPNWYPPRKSWYLDWDGSRRNLVHNSTWEIVASGISRLKIWKRSPCLVDARLKSATCQIWISPVSYQDEDVASSICRMIFGESSPFESPTIFLCHWCLKFHNDCQEVL